jgi:hypothetical protein
VQTAAYPAGRDLPVDVLKHPFHNPIAYVLHKLAAGQKVDGPLSPKIARIGQQIVDTAVKSVRTGRVEKLLG